VLPTDILDLEFWVKVVDVFDISRSEERDILLPLILLSSGSQFVGGAPATSGTPATSGSPGLTLDNPWAVLVFVKALLPNVDWDDLLPLIAMGFGTQAYGLPSNVTQGNILPFLLLLSSQRGGRGRQHEIREQIEEEGRAIGSSLNDLVQALAGLVRANTASQAAQARTDTASQAGHEEASGTQHGRRTTDRND
jgi:hypothetical protein